MSAFHSTLPIPTSLFYFLLCTSSHPFSTLSNRFQQTGRVSPRTSTRGGDAGSPKPSQNPSQNASQIPQSQHSNSPVHSSPLQQETSSSTIQNQIQSTSNTPNLNREKENQGNMKGDGAALPGSLGGRSTMESMPVHMPSQGFREGGERGITRIREEGS